MITLPFEVLPTKLASWYLFFERLVAFFKNFINIYYIYSTYKWNYSLISLPMKYEKIISSGKTVFHIQDLMLLFGSTQAQSVRNFLQRIKKKNIMKKVQNGVWTLSTYNTIELANKLKKNSYVSCETVLKEVGAIFQYYGSTITSVSDNTLTKNIDNITYTYKKIKNKILSNPEWIIIENHTVKATPERALCDCHYLYPSWHSDDLSMIDRKLAISLSHHYNQRVISIISQLAHDRQKDS